MQSDGVINIGWNVHSLVGKRFGLANVYGYHTHNKMLFEEVKKVANITDQAEDVVSIISAESFVPVAGKFNWLFTMWEGLDMPDFYVESCQRADYILVPSNWVKDVFSQYLYPKPIYVVNHGVEETFEYKERRMPNKGERFRYLWIGAPNTRKGFEEIMFAWKRLGLNKLNEVELYLKTTGLKYQGIEKILSSNVIVDNRDISRDELLDIYYSSHCFLFPSRGEGFGLTLAEAMATGLPCVATNFGGVTDFFDEVVGYPIDYFIATATFTFFKPDPKDTVNVDTRVGMPEVGQLASMMLYIPRHYSEALEKGYLASERIHNYFTWQKAAHNLVSCVRAEVEYRRNGDVAHI